MLTFGDLKMPYLNSSDPPDIGGQGLAQAQRLALMSGAGPALVDNEAARTGLVSSDDAFEGLLVVQKDVRQVFMRTASGWLGLGSAGMVPSSVTVNSGSATAYDDGAVRFAGATSVSLDSVFTDSAGGIYRVFGIADTSNANVAVMVRQRRAGTDNSANEHGTQYGGGTGSSPVAGATTAPQFYVQGGVSGTGTTVLDFMIARPDSAADRTMFLGLTAAYNSAQTSLYGWVQRGPNTTKDADGLTMFCGAGTMAGLIKVVKLA